jgi:hypothetical protein
MWGMGELKPIGAPQEARDAAEFVALLRRLKQRSGLSYRQLERRAAERGEVLPRSTLADVLRQGALPRVETVEVFLRACGQEQNAEALLAVWHRIATTDFPGARAAPEDGASPARDGQESPTAGAGRPGSARPLYRLFSPRGRVLGAALALGVLVAGGYFTLAATDNGNGKPEAAGESASPVPGTYRIRSLASSLCLSERDGEEAGYVYQSHCPSSIPAYALEEEGGGVYRIRSLHPVFGYGCLGVANGSTKGGARMMDDYCGHRGVSERFRLKPVGAGGYRIMPLHTNACVSVPGSSDDQWAPVLQNPCDPGDTGQVFRFDPVPSPSVIPTITSNV